MANKLALIFPGQGSQRPGMAKDFYEAYPESKAAFDTASQALDLDMPNLCFTENEQLNQTEFTQPAILTAEIAIWSALHKAYPNLQPSAFAGHSLGEYTALVAAGVMQLADAVKIVRKRGALMQRAVPLGVGAMAALVLDNITSTDCAALVRGAGAEVANLNSPAQFVISGKKEAVEAACSTATQKIEGLRAIPLNVSAPFHSSLMRPIEAEFRQYLSSFSGNMQLERASTVLSNFTGTFHTAASLVDSLVSQISGSVQWLANMNALAALGGDILEIGPNRVLSKFLSTIGANAKSIIDMKSAQKALAA
ncbi:MAG: ACP S-malonyltransferase [Oligoflexia bacterium]|nr:ACP S-malonyltransferase [Oligoflexia bacterium]